MVNRSLSALCKRFDVCCFLLLNLLITPLTAQESTIDSEELSARLKTECEQAGLPAMWAGSFYADGRPSVLAAAGVRKWKSDQQAEVDDVVHLGSCTKAMTAVIIGQLCSEGKLSLDTSLGEIFQTSEVITGSAWKNVTVRELLQHRSGMPGNSLNYGVFDGRFPDSVVDARHAFMESVLKRRRSKSPQFNYSNEGYITLGHITEQLTGKPWEELIQERIFVPLEISSSGFGPVGEPDGSPKGQTLPGRAWGHTPAIDLADVFAAVLGNDTSKNLTPQQIDNSRCLGPAGRVHMNLNDWSKFVLPFASENGYERFKITREVWQELLKPDSGAKSGEEYAGGWVLLDQPRLAGTAYFHNGSNTTWYCYALAVPGKKQCVLLATNVFSDAARKACNDVALMMVGAVDSNK